MTYRLKAVIAAALMGVSAPAFAQDSATAQSSAEIIVAIDITNDDPLSFGVIARPATGSGTVTINPDTGARTVSGGVAAVTGGTTGRALFSVTGDPTRAFSTTIPANFILSNGTPADDITVTLTAETTPATALDALGEATIGVGGTFGVDFDTTTDEYTGSFSVTVQYN